MKFLSYVIVLATTLSSLTTAAAATDVTLEQEVDAFAPGPFNGGRYTGINRQACLVPVQHRLAAAAA